MDRKVVTELIQEDCNAEMITSNLTAIVDGAERNKMLKDYHELNTIMGTAGASETTAKLMVKFLTLPS